MANHYKKNPLGKTLGLFGFMLFALFFTKGGFAAPISGNLTIDKTSAASATNYTSFQSLFTDLNTNGVNGPVNVTVLNGPYTERVKADAISGVSATNTITIDGNNQVLQNTATSTSTMATFMFNGADYVTLKNLYIKALGTSYSWGVQFYNSSNNNKVDNCIVEITNSTSTSSTYNWGIVFSNSTTSPTSSGTVAKDCEITNCTIKGGGANKGPYGGICIAAQNQNVDANILIENNTIQGFYCYGIRMYYVSGVKVKNNDISRPVRTNSTTAYGIEMYYYCYRDTLEGNKIHNMYDGYSSYTGTFYGIRCYYQYNTSNSLVANNLVYDNQMAGYHYLLYSYYSDGITYAHNTLSSDLSATHSSYIYGAYFYSYTTSRPNTYFLNNVISLTTPGTGYRYAYYYYTKDVVMNNNSFYTTGATNSRFSNGQLLTYDLVDWQNSTSSFSGGALDLSSVEANPKFKNPGAVNFAPTVVQIDGVGIPIGSVTTDINGVARDLNNPDPGAFTFNVDAKVTRMVLAGANACQQQTEDVNVWVYNNSPDPQSDFYVGYRINGGAEVFEPYKATLNAGDSAMFTFKVPVTYSNTGIYNFEARIKGKAFVGPYGVNVNPAPLGAEVAKGPKFNGQLFSGNDVDPDIVANPDTIIYELKPPTGYLNKDYGVTWVISKLSASTINGGALSGSDTATKGANVSAGARLTFKPSAALTDSQVRFTLTVFSLTNNCYAPDITRDVFVAPRPVASAIITDVCDGDAAPFQSTATISSGTMSYVWDFGDGTTSNFADNLKKYAAHGTYTVTLTAESNYGYKDVYTKTINVYQKPIPDFAVVNQCEGSPVPFTDNSTVFNGGLTYEWSFGDAAKGTSTTQSPTYAYSTIGSYFVTLAVTDAQNCFAQVTKPVTYSASPMADFNFPALACNQDEVMFTNASVPAGKTGYSWNFGDGSVSQSQNATHTYAAAGNYIVTVTARNDFGCIDSMSKSLTLLESPMAGYTLTSQCITEPVMFTNTTTEPAGSTVVYAWEFGDGSSSSNKDETHTYTSVGDYEVVLKAIASNGCKTEKRDIVVFAEKPIVNFSSPQTACVNDNVEFTNSSIAGQGTLTYAWDLGDGNLSTAINPTNTYTTAGVRTIKLVAASAKGCYDSASSTLTISAIPNSDFVFESGKTGDGRMVFTPSAANGSGEYTWVYGDGGTSTNKAQHDYVYVGGLGLFKVTLKITDNGCSSSTTKDVIINAMGIAGASLDNTINVYPNPSNGVFGIKMSNNEQVTAINVYSVIGAKVLTQKYDKTLQAFYPIDLSAEKSGIYLINVTTTTGTYSAKVTISR
jgi:PKD repeat protein